MPSSNGQHERAQTKLDVELPPTVDAPARARRVLDRLDGIDETTRDDARLVVSELVSNSVRHAGLSEGDRIRLEVEDRPEVVRIRVVDPGGGFEPRIADDPPARASRWGLHLIERIASQWGVSSGGQTEVWCEIDRRTPRSA